MCYFLSLCIDVKFEKRTSFYHKITLNSFLCIVLIDILLHNIRQETKIMCTIIAE